jgi:putative transposase
VKTLFIEPGSPWENVYCESFDSKLKDELLNGETFSTLREAQVLHRKPSCCSPWPALRFASDSPRAGQSG